MLGASGRIEMADIPVNLGKRALSVNEFCAAYSLGRTRTYSEISAGRLSSITIGRKRLIPADSAEAWLANLSELPITSRA